MPSVTVVGLGTRFPDHVCPETRTHIANADKVYYVLADPFTRAWIEDMNPSAELLPFYEDGPRRDVSAAWASCIVSAAKGGQTVCVVLYGHPGICMPPVQALLARARSDGVPLQLLPAISSADCLLADLGVDPCEAGLQLFEATDFLVRRRSFDACSGLLLFQVGIIGLTGYRHDDVNLEGFSTLVDVLREHFGDSHEIVLYEAADFPIRRTSVQGVPLTQAYGAPVTARTTLYAPPLKPPPWDMDMLSRLGLAGRPGFPSV